MQLSNCDDHYFLFFVREYALTGPEIGKEVYATFGWPRAVAIDKNKGFKNRVGWGGSKFTVTVIVFTPPTKRLGFARFVLNSCVIRKCFANRIVSNCFCFISLTVRYEYLSIFPSFYCVVSQQSWFEVYFVSIFFVLLPQISFVLLPHPHPPQWLIVQTHVLQLDEPNLQVILFDSREGRKQLAVDVFIRRKP